MRAGMLNRSKTLGLPVDDKVFTVAYLINWLHDCPACPCCGRVFDVTYKEDRKKRDTSPSLDRFDLGAGYVVGNVALICWRCNNLKRNATIEELQQVVDWMKLFMEARDGC
jgi:hypothetical protein